MFGTFCALLASVSLHPLLETRPPDIEVPLEPINNQLVVRVKINGKEARFSLDSGSFEVRVQPQTALDLNLINAKGVPVDLVSSIQTTFDVDMTIGDRRLPTMLMTMMKMFVSADGTSVTNQEYGGVLGLDFLKNTALGVDMRKSRVAIWLGGKVSESDVKEWMGEEYVTSAFAPLGKRGRYRVKGALAGKKAEFLFDTGCGYLLQTESQAKSYGVSLVMPSPARFLEGTWSTFVGAGPELRVPWRTLPAPYALTIGADGSKAGEDTVGERRAAGVIGLETIVRSRAVLDFAGKKIYVSSRPTDVEWPDYLASFGFRVVNYQDKPAAFVCAGGPAAKAGMKDLDYIESIGGVPATIQAESQPIADLMGKPSLPIKIRRGDEVIDLILQK